MTETSAIKPALTEEEWATKTRKGQDPALLTVTSISLKEYANEDGVWNSVRVAGRQGVVYVNRPDLPALAALCLYGQPYGFTAEDIDLLKRLWSSAQECGNPIAFTDSAAGDLAARIAALLPPQEPT